MSSLTSSHSSPPWASVESYKANTKGLAALPHEVLEIILLEVLAHQTFYIDGLVDQRAASCVDAAASDDFGVPYIHAPLWTGSQLATAPPLDRRDPRRDANMFVAPAVPQSPLVRTTSFLPFMATDYFEAAYPYALPVSSVDKFFGPPGPIRSDRVVARIRTSVRGQLPLQPATRPAIMYTCRALYAAAAPLFYARNTFHFTAPQTALPAFSGALRPSLRLSVRRLALTVLVVDGGEYNLVWAVIASAFPNLRELHISLVCWINGPLLARILIKPQDEPAFGAAGALHGLARMGALRALKQCKIYVTLGVDGRSVGDAPRVVARLGWAQTQLETWLNEHGPDRLEVPPADLDVDSAVQTLARYPPKDAAGRAAWHVSRRMVEAGMSQQLWALLRPH